MKPSSRNLAETKYNTLSVAHGSLCATSPTSFLVTIELVCGTVGVLTEYDYRPIYRLIDLSRFSDHFFGWVLPRLSVYILYQFDLRSV